MVGPGHIGSNNNPQIFGRWLLSYFCTIKKVVGGTSRIIAKLNKSCFTEVKFQIPSLWLLIDRIKACWKSVVSLVVSLELQIKCINLESSANMYMVDDTRRCGKLFIYSKITEAPKYCLGVSQTVQVKKMKLCYQL